MDRFLLMTCFARAVELGSLSAAGRDLGLSQPNVSRYVAALEAHLQVRLLHRSTRKLSLTQEGERYYAEVRAILDAVNESESAARANVEPSGVLRVACPTLLAHTFLSPHIPEFLAQYSEVELDLQFSDRYVDLIEESVELAIRIGHLQDTSLRARRIGQFERVCVASERYIAAHGCPATPDDLRDHDCVIYTHLSSGATWHFPGGPVPVSGRIRVNSPQAACDMISAGLGIGHGPRWMFDAGLKDGSVRQILVDHVPPVVPVQLVYVANRLMPARVRVFMDFIAQKFMAIPAFNPKALRPF